jgi:hypothetical protein
VPVAARSTGYCDKAVTQQVNVIDCISSATYDLKVSATAYCTGSSVTFALSNTTLGRTYRLYKDGGAVMNALPGTGGGATFTGAFSGAGSYTAQVTAEGGNCPALMTGTHNVNENPLPTNLSLTANPTTICNGQSSTLTASATSGASYSIDNNAWQTTTLFKVSPTSTTSYPLYVKTAAGCSTSVTNAATVAVNDLPAVPTLNSPSSVCAGNYLTFTASGGSGYYDWAGDVSRTGSSKQVGTANGNYTARVRSYQTSSGTTCYSSYTGDVTGTIQAPASAGQTATACGCATGNIPCGGICKTSGTYTTDDGDCTGVCNTAYVQLRNQCDVVIKEDYDTYHSESCAAGCEALPSTSCYPGGTILWTYLNYSSVATTQQCARDAAAAGYSCYTVRNIGGYTTMHRCYACNCN